MALSNHLKTFDKWPLEKWHGAGNDFIIVEDVEIVPAFVRFICDRHRGVGADGLLVLSASNIADIKMEIFNQDGSKASMCGNGIRCAAAYLGKDYSRIEVSDNVLECSVEGNSVTVEMGSVQFVGEDLVECGVVHRIADKEFQDSVNVTAYDAINGILYVKTTERGVGPTQACGTGIVAACFHFGQEGVFEARSRGGDSFICWIEKGKARLQGPASRVFTGMIEPFTLQSGCHYANRNT